MKIRITVVPSAVGIQSRQTGYPLVVAIVHPSGSHREFAIRSKGCHIQNTECHLPNVVVGNTVFEMVDVFVIELLAVVTDSS